MQLVIPAAAGFFLARSGLFPVQGSRAASQVGPSGRSHAPDSALAHAASTSAVSAAQIILNVTLPSLLFSKIIPSFTSDNISALGPIVLVAVVYLGISLVLTFLLRSFTRVPDNFHYGIIAAGGWSNWGDLPTSVVQTICTGAPFNGTADGDLAIAYV